MRGIAVVTRAVVLARRPRLTLRSDDLRVAAIDLPPLGEGEVRVAVRCLSLEPFTRLYLDERLLGGAIPGIAIGAPLPGAGVGEVLESRHEGFVPGDFVEGRTGWCECAVVNGAALRKLDLALGDPAMALGILGLPGTTAYTGIVEVAGVRPGETVIVSSAAGAVGLIAGQIAKALGARAVGIAGGPDKCALVLEHGFDACVDYKAPGLAERLVEACPGGAQVYFDNVGGEVAMAAYGALAHGARVALCGLLSHYQDEGDEPGDLGRFMRLIMSKGLRVEAFATALRCPPSALPDLSRWMKEGAIRLPVTTVQGLDACPAAYVDLLEGRITGKLIVAIAGG